MAKEELLATLQELHQKLSDANEVDEETRQMLTTVTADIERLVAQKESPPPDDVDSAQTQLRELLLKFESRHPRITSIIHDIADGLANLGI